MADQSVDEPDQSHADAATLHDQPGENEERDGEQNEIAGAIDHGLRQHHEGAGIGGPEVSRGREQEHEAHGHAGENCNEEHSKGDDDGAIAAEPGQPKLASDGRKRQCEHEAKPASPCHPPVQARKVVNRVDRKQRHAEGERECYERGGQL